MHLILKGGLLIGFLGYDAFFFFFFLLQSYYHYHHHCNHTIVIIYLLYIYYVQFFKYNYVDTCKKHDTTLEPLFLHKPFSFLSFFFFFSLACNVWRRYFVSSHMVFSSSKIGLWNSKKPTERLSTCVEGITSPSVGNYYKYRKKKMNRSFFSPTFLDWINTIYARQ